MNTTQERFARWEHHNQQRLRLMLEVSRKQIRQIFQLLSFLLFLFYKGGKLTMEVLRVLWMQSNEADRYLEEARSHRLNLSTFPSKWI